MFKWKRFITLGLLASLFALSIVSHRPTRAADELNLTPQAYLPIIGKNWTPFPFTLSANSPAYVSNIANSNGCAWFGMAGQVLDLQNRGIVGFFVHVEGNGLYVDAPTGSVPKYGVSGWEVTLGGAPLESTNTYSIQLRNGAGQPLSESYIIPTFNDCMRNHILVNFVQVR